MKVRTIALLLLPLVFACADARTKEHAGVKVRLVSIARMAEHEYGVMGTMRARDPQDEIAVVQLELSPAGSLKVKLPSKDCELKDTAGKSYHPNSDIELTLGGKDSKMVWDFDFAVPKTAMLETLRIGSATFKLGGVRELDPGARSKAGPGSQ